MFHNLRKIFKSDFLILSTVKIEQILLTVKTERDEITKAIELAKLPISQNCLQEIRHNKFACLLPLNFSHNSPLQKTPPIFSIANRSCWRVNVHNNDL